MAEVHWSLKAESDLYAIEEFISKDSPLRPFVFVDWIVEAAERLAGSPLLGRLVPEFEREDLREIMRRGYRLVYIQGEERVTVLGVVHSARDLKGLAMRELWDLS